MNRKPPNKVIRQLRQEVGFCCPGLKESGEPCGSPLLTWHHFDPPWRERQHHDPAGMIALCSNCHGQADLLTKEQLRKIKDAGRERAATIAHRFAWRRRKLLVVLGGNFFTIVT